MSDQPAIGFEQTWLCIDRQFAIFLVFIWLNNLSFIVVATLLKIMRLMGLIFSFFVIAIDYIINLQVQQINVSIT